MDGFQRRTQKKRKAILDASFSLFNQYGYHNVTIARISKEAHVSLETIYNYFESKENLKRELLGQIIDDFCVLTESILESDLPIETKFEKLLLSKLDFSTRFSPQFLTEELHELNDLDLFGSEENKQLLNSIMLQMIRQGREGKIITVEASKEALTTYFKIFQFYITNNLSSALQIGSNDMLLKEIYFLFFNGLKSKPNT
ncbi:HTH-type transcriptional regulator BetI [bioreactor metagenome]|uniref:HTH-type transcriptional regulator BetI n=1 Tax=bioreactor metagenome TaxID=1076179 RepID=A0A644WX24_9ZZZZ